MSIAEKLKTIAENEQKVFASGKEEGKKSEYDAFWDEFQANGNRSSAAMMFASAGWNDNTFRPKHSLRNILNAGNMFNTCSVTDLKAALERQGVVFDFKKCTNCTSAFSYSKLTVIPEVNLSTPAALAALFQSSKDLHTVEKLILSEGGKQTFSNAFSSCESLRNIVIEGVIGNDVDLHWSTLLSKESIVSIINALSDTTTGKTATFSKTATENAFTGTPITLSPEVVGDDYDDYEHTVGFADGVASVKLNGGRSIETGGSSCMIYFFNNSLPSGRYEISVSTEGSTEVPYSVALVDNTGLACQVASGSTATYERDDDGSDVQIQLDIQGLCEDYTVNVSLKQVNEWDALVATKKNWTISRV